MHFMCNKNYAAFKTITFLDNIQIYTGTVAVIDLNLHSYVYVNMTIKQTAVVVIFLISNTTQEVVFSLYVYPQLSVCQMKVKRFFMFICSTQAPFYSLRQRNREKKQGTTHTLLPSLGLYLCYQKVGLGLIYYCMYSHSHIYKSVIQIQKYTPPFINLLIIPTFVYL